MDQTATPAKKLGALEWAMIVIIVALIATVAIPRFMGYSATVNKQEEAKNMLRFLWELELAYKEQHDLFWPEPNAEGLTLTARLSSDRGQYIDDSLVTLPWNAVYSYEISAPDSGRSLLIEAEGNIDDDPTLDVWSINHFGQVVHRIHD